MRLLTIIFFPSSCTCFWLSAFFQEVLFLLFLANLHSMRDEPLGFIPLILRFVFFRCF